MKKHVAESVTVGRVCAGYLLIGMMLLVNSILHVA